MPATLTRRRACSERSRKARRPQLEPRTLLVPIAAARQVVEEASFWLGVALPGRYAAGLAFRAQIIYAHSPSFREKLDRPGSAGRDLLYVFMRHWFAARLRVERYDLFVRLPHSYWVGKPLPLPSPYPPLAGAYGIVYLSNETRLLSDIW